MEICSRFDTESRREDLVDTDPSKQGANIVPISKASRIKAYCSLKQINMR